MHPQDLERAVLSAVALAEATDDTTIKRQVAAALTSIDTLQYHEVNPVSNERGDHVILDRADENRWIQSSVAVEPPR